MTSQEEKKQTVTPAQQAVSASAGSIVTVLTSTPLEVLKVRQQAAATSSSVGLFQIARAEGALALWSGLGPSLLMSIPSTVLYLTVYEAARDELVTRSWLSRDWAPLVAGGLSRLVSSTCVAPLELVRTRMQAAESGTAEGVAAVAHSIVRQGGGVGALWGGLWPTLWRDVPFSCIYWLGYETLKQRAAAGQPSGGVPVSTSFGAGALAGLFAATLTTPLDVVKTRQQLRVAGGGAAEGTAETLGRLVRTEGWNALFAGLAPRLTKVVPSCAIMIGSYELGKRYLSGRPWEPPALPLRPPGPRVSSFGRVGVGSAEQQEPHRPCCLGRYLSACSQLR